MTRLLAFFLALALACSIACQTKPTDTASAGIAPPLSLETLRERQFSTTLVYARSLPDGPQFRAHLVSYTHSALTLYALVATPKTAPPDNGFPIVVANHGYVPDPRKYGITREGVDSRPGDYYRSVPELFTSRGFLVVMPDYRGHNSSAGFEFINPQNDDSVAYYAEDVVALMSALKDIDSADTNNVFMWSHSMGGPVSMRALLATDVVKAASFWATMSVDDLTSSIAELDVPMTIHHASADASTDHANSERLAAVLQRMSRSHVFFSYNDDRHFFEGSIRELAADRDAELFKRSMQ